MRLALPLAAGLAGVVVAVLCGLPAINRRLSTRAMGVLAALPPLVALGAILACLPELRDGAALTLELTWMPSLGLGAWLYLDALSALFAILITGIGALVLIYAGYYFDGDATAWRFLTFLQLFLTAMLGVVLAGDVVTLFVFWEGTTLTSFLLVGYRSDAAAARRGALQSLLVTGTGGIALLVGLLALAAVAGQADLPALLASGDRLRTSPWYPAIVVLVALGAFTKSAQVPFHFWLPNAMAAPTPASAYLHSATMVKAGLYLLARLHPALGGTGLWFWMLSTVGAVTMLMGGIVAIRQRDLKAMLAYTTIAQLGALTMLIGQETGAAFKALVIGLVAHALYKSTLFLVVGIVDHATGTRDLDRLGGLRRVLPASFAIATVAALSMAGLPPLFGFLAKETKLVTLLAPELPALANTVLPAAAVVWGALSFAVAATLITGTFLGTVRDPACAAHAHEAPTGMLLASAVPAMLSLAIGLAPEPASFAGLLAEAAHAAFGAPVKVSLALWAGLTAPLALSALAVTLGALLFTIRCRLRVSAPARRWSLDALYARALGAVDAAAALATRSQSGHLRHYLAVVLLASGGLLAWRGAFPPLPAAVALEAGELPLLRAFTLVLSAAAAAVAVVLRQDLLAVLALGASGLGVALLMALAPAPDVALVQVVVDILTTVLLALALARIPRAARASAPDLTFLQRRAGLARDALLASGCGVVVAALSLQALATRPRTSVVTPYYETHAKTGTGATDIVGAIVVDFRGFDTLIEISVFAMAGLGIAALLARALRTAGAPDDAPAPHTGPRLLSFGIGGAVTSAFVHLLAYVTLPLALVLAATHVMYGHQQPGDGFTAGVIVSLAVGLWYAVLDPASVRRHLAWLRPAPLVASGLLLALASATLPVLLGGAFFAPADLGGIIGLPLPRGFALSTSFLFEVAICMTVLGGASAMIDALRSGRSGDQVPAP